MNQFLYRVIFSPARGQSMVVAETVVSHAASGQACRTRSSRRPGLWVTLRPVCLALSWSWAGVMLPVATGHAQVIADPAAPKNQQPTILNAPNGVPLVNIQSPSAAGVSRNTYRQFDVNAQGVILNNARQSALTRLGGWVQGNPWLAAGSARLILNEVNASHPSQLRGYIEVAGSRAQVIVANPAGISCDGCGFINANRATLTTGQPLLDQGRLEGYRTAQGVIDIHGTGLDGRQTDFTELIARAVEVNASIWAQDLKLQTGASEVDAGLTHATPLPGNGPAPAYLLDVAQLGGMYAGKIALVGNEHGVGVRNAGLVHASAGDLTLSIDGHLDNTRSGVLQSAGRTRIDTPEHTTTNRGVIDGTSTRVTARQLDNPGTGRLYGNHVSIEAGTLLNREESLDGMTPQAATIAARERLDIGVQTLINREQALIFSAGDQEQALNIGGALDENGHATGQAALVHNASATIESLGGMQIASARLTNSNEHFASDEFQVGPSRSMSYIQPLGDPNRYEAGNFVWEGWSRAGRYRWKNDPPPNDSGVPGASPLPRVGEQACTGTEGIDETCIRLPGADYLADNPAWQYFGLTPPEPEPGKPEEARFATPAEYQEALAQWGIRHTAWETDTASRYDTLDARIDSYNDGFASREIRDWTQFHVTRTEYETRVVSSAPAVIRAAGNLTLTGNELVNDRSQILAGRALRGDLHALDNLDAIGTYRVNETGTSQYTYSRWRGGFKRYHERKWDGLLAYTPADELTRYGLDVVEAREYASLTGGHDASRASQGLPDSSLFQLNPGSDRYFIETDPRFADYRNWLSSDYLLQAMAVDPATVQKRLGDGFYEQKLVREQIGQLTGRRFLEGHASDEAQYQALLQNGATLAMAWGLRPGVELTPEQVARLTSDIVWLVEEPFTLPDGSVTQALVPRVYVKVRPDDLDGRGTLIAADQLELNLQQDLRNQGTLAGRTLVQVTGDNLRNAGGRILADTVALQARTDLDNQGGRLQADSMLLASAGRDINVSSTTYSDARQAGASSFSRTGIDRIASVYVGNTDGQLLLQAGQDIHLNAAQIVNDGSAGLTQLSAGRNLELGTVRVAEQENNVLNAGNYLKQGETRDVGTRIQSRGDISLLAGQDISTRAASIHSEQGVITLAAAGDISIASGEASQNWSEGRQHTRRGTLKSSTTTTRDSQEQTRALGSTLSGQSVIVEGNNLDITGSHVVSTAGTVLVAGNDIRIGSATDTSSESHFRDEKKSGLFNSGGIGFTIGTQQQSADNQNTATHAAASTVGATSGDVTISAGNNYKQDGSHVVAPQGNIDIAAKKIDILEAQETSHGTYETKFKQSGLTVTVTAPLVSAIQTAQ
ncbi:filamentous hemagglutinin N-terminal domain-containing protein, partial [Laribacter hongkongensis]|uniref:two-partner secretion domain-containing protein n=1 Tax=Laribacter hongkongensis TaxID=168471 RepID=UPI001EFD6BE0